MELKRSKTWKNLLTAFDGESKACAKYLIFELKAREDGYEQMGDIFHETSMNEREHAEIWYKWLHDHEMPATYDNLINAAQGEHYEHSEMYREFSDTARREGFYDLAKLFKEVGEIEYHHETRYLRLAENIKNDTVFCKPCKKVWICMVCGHVSVGECAPDPCPVCKHTQAFAQLKADNY